MNLREISVSNIQPRHRVESGGDNVNLSRLNANVFLLIFHSRDNILAPPGAAYLSASCGTNLLSSAVSKHLEWTITLMNKYFHIFLPHEHNAAEDLSVEEKINDKANTMLFSPELWLTLWSFIELVASA